MEKYMRQVGDNIEKHGFHIQGVMQEQGNPDYYYTVGFAGLGLPEMILFGLAPEAALTLFHGIAHMRQVDRRDFSDGTVDYDLANLPTAFRTPKSENTAEEWMAVACRYHGTSRLSVLQVVWPDQEGFMPWEDGYDSKWLVLQPLL